MSTENYNRGYSGQAPLPGGGIVAGESHAQGVIDSQRHQSGYNDKTSSAITLLILGVPFLIFWAAAGESGGAATALAWGTILACLAGASLGAGVATFVALSLLVALSKSPGRFGSPRRAFVYAAMVSLLGGSALMWMGLESVAQVAKDGAAASGLVTASAGGIGWLIRVADWPLAHGLWQSPALDIAQGNGGAGSLPAAVLMLAVPVLAFTLALRRLCGTGMALALGIVTQAGIAFVVVALLSSAFQQL